MYDMLSHPPAVKNSDKGESIAYALERCDYDTLLDILGIRERCETMLEDFAAEKDALIKMRWYSGERELEFFVMDGSPRGFGEFVAKKLLAQSADKDCDSIQAEKSWPYELAHAIEHLSSYYRLTDKLLENNLDRIVN